MNEKINVYSDVVDAGLIQSKKEKYTMKDFKKLSLNYDQITARFILICSAMYHFKKDYHKHISKKMLTEKFMNDCVYERAA